MVKIYRDNSSISSMSAPCRSEWGGLLQVRVPQEGLP